MKIGIAGFGFVGQALYHIIKDKEIIEIYDSSMAKYDEISNLRECSIVFVCLPTPMFSNDDKHQDIGAIEKFFHDLSIQQKITGNWNPLIVFKSTISYSNILKFVDSYDIVFNPEFLSQNTSFEDSTNQDFIILGGRIDNMSRVKLFYEQHSSLKSTFELMPLKEAVEFKYIRNIYGAYKVLFWNWVQDQTGNARKHADLYSKIPQGEMSQVAADGKRGFGGACFQKDLAAFHTEYPHELTDFIMKYNSKIRNEDSNLYCKKTLVMKENSILN